MTGIIALTGASGFIGGHVARRLARDGWRLRALVHHTLPEAEGADLTIVRGSLDDEASLAELVEGADAVVHCAGLVRAASRHELRRINAEATGRLARLAAQRTPSGRFVFVSSLAAREPTLSAYAASKREGERALLDLGASPAWTILRSAAVYGPGDEATLPFFRQVRRGLAFVPGGKASRASLLYVDDLAGLVSALVSGQGGEGSTFEVDDGRPGGYSWDEIVATAAREMDKDISCLPVPRALTQAVAAANVGWSRLMGRRALITPGKVRELYHPDWVVHGEGACASTDWRPEVDLDEGFKRTIAWYRDHGWL